MSKIGVIGQGFVGSAVREGMKNYFTVITYDKDPNKQSTAKSISDVVSQVDETFLCVPTPMRKDGSCDLSIVKAALEEIASAVVKQQKKGFIVVIKSTIPPGTTEALAKGYPEFSLIFNPEFLTEANAVEDYKNQNRIILGGDRYGTTKMKQIFAKAFPEVPIIKTSATIAETIKYVTNTFLAMKVSYANEIYALCQKLDIDYDKVVEYARYDNRIGNSHWAVPGPDGDLGFGGSCFPKDTQALIYMCNQLGVDATMLQATWEKNLLVRPAKDWEALKGRAVSEE
jgi:UDPglucose 6-dehydrogenase